MESEDEEFSVSAPTKKVKKNNGEAAKGKKKKASPTDDASPKRKTPVKKSAKEKEETKKEKAKPKKGKGKKQDDEDEETQSRMLGDDDDFENYNPNELSNGDFEEEESENSRSKNKSSEKKATKGKKGASGGGSLDSDQQQILEYMKKTNRPYSVINIFDNLHGKIKKPACQKALDALIDAGQLQEKEFGKAKVYLLNQQIIPQVSAEELDRLKEKEKKSRIEHQKLAEEVKEMNAYLKGLTNQLTNEQIAEDNEKLTKALQELESKLELYESGNYPMISDEEMKVAEDNRKKFEVEYKKRKRMCMDMVNSIADSMEQKNAVIIDMIGIEID